MLKDHTRLKSWPIKCQIKFNMDTCKMMHKGKKNKNLTAYTEIARAELTITKS